MGYFQSFYWKNNLMWHNWVLSVCKENMAWSPRTAFMRLTPSINLCFQLTTSVAESLILLCFCRCVFVWGVLFFWFSHKLPKIHSLTLASLVSMQPPGPIHHPQGNGDGTVMPRGSGERGATAAFWNCNCYAGVSCTSVTLNALLTLLCSKIHQVNWKGKCFKASLT